MLFLACGRCFVWRGRGHGEQRGTGPGPEAGCGRLHSSDRAYLPRSKGCYCCSRGKHEHGGRPGRWVGSATAGQLAGTKRHMNQLGSRLDPALLLTAATWGAVHGAPVTLGAPLVAAVRREDQKRC